MQPNDAKAEVQKFEIPKLDATLTLWLILFVFGGGLLALYYAGIGYFPEVSWQDTLTFLALMTIIGGSLLLAYSFLLFVPGAIWSEFLIFDEQLRNVLMMSARRWEPCVWSVTKQVLFPFALFMAFCHFLLFLYEPNLPGFVPIGALASLSAVSGLLARDLNEGLITVAMNAATGKPSVIGATQDDTRPLRKQRSITAACHAPLCLAFIIYNFGHCLASTILWIFALLPFAGCLALLIEWGQRKRRQQLVADPSSKPSVPDHVSLLCRAVLAFASAALLSLMALWFFHRIYRGRASESSVRVPWQLLVLCTLVVIVTNLAVSVLFHQRRRQALFASLLAALLLLGAGEIIGEDPHATLPAKIMEKFGFGGKRGTLVLTERGGRLLCQHGVPVVFEKRKETSELPPTSPDVESSSTSPDTAKNGKQEKSNVLARAEGIAILSRLGSEYLLQYCSPSKRTLTLPKSEFVSWSTLLDENESKAKDKGELQTPKAAHFKEPVDAKNSEEIESCETHVFSATR